jgi:hypothetical protein
VWGPEKSLDAWVVWIERENVDMGVDGSWTWDAEMLENRF